jgi:hypothetical protein
MWAKSGITRRSPIWHILLNSSAIVGNTIAIATVATRQNLLLYPSQGHFDQIQQQRYRPESGKNSRGLRGLTDQNRPRIKDRPHLDSL